MHHATHTANACKLSVQLVMHTHHFAANCLVLHAQPLKHIIVKDRHSYFMLQMLCLQAHVEGSQEAWEQVFCDLHGNSREAEGKLAARLAAKMLRDCPHVVLREQVMSSLYQHHPFSAVLCGVLMAKQQKMSPACYGSMLLALQFVLSEGNLSVHPCRCWGLELCVRDKHLLQVLLVQVCSLAPAS